MDIPDIVKARFEPLNQRNFEKLRETVLRPNCDYQGLKQLRDKAKTEWDLRELYRGRTKAFYELLQNADDAGATQVSFILCPDGLALVHDGSWFTVENFHNLADGWSDKDSSQCIGHKGLGFRSVLDVTPAPHLIRIASQEFLAIKFSWSLNNGHIRQTFQRDPPLQAFCEKWTEHGRSCCPIMYIPGLVKKQSLGAGLSVFNALNSGRYGQGMTTLFWLPAGDSDVDPHVLKDLGPEPVVSNSDGRQRVLDFLQREVTTLLPFLKSVNVVSAFAIPTTLPHQREGNRNLVIPKRFRIVATLNSFDRQFVNNLSQAIRRRFTFITVNIPDKRPGGAAWTSTAAPVPLAVQEYAVVIERAASRVANRLTSLDTSKTAGMLKTIRGKLNGPFVPLMTSLFELIERVRYAGQDQRVPHLPIGTAQIIDTVELFMLRVVQDDIANAEAGPVLDWAVSVKIVPLFDSDVVAPESLREFIGTLTSPFDKYTRREFLNILAAGMHFVE